MVTTDLVLPCEPDLDWSGCVVRISEGALVTMPRVLREIEPEELAVRRDECARLFRVIMEPDAAEKMFQVALEVWALRVLQAKERHAYLNSLDHGKASSRTGKQSRNSPGSAPGSGNNRELI